jgi:hypothetical protein
MTAFPKFGWMAAVAEDDRLSASARLVLTYIAHQNVHRDDDWFCVRQVTVAAKLHMRRQTVAMRCVVAGSSAGSNWPWNASAGAAGTRHTPTA